MKLTGENRSTQEETCSSATLSTTNPTWTDPGSNPGLRGGRPAANRLSHATALVNDLYLLSERIDSLCLGVATCIRKAGFNTKTSRFV
jgi:hypothetical protein